MISSCVTTFLRSHSFVASRGMNSMNRISMLLSRPYATRSRISSSFAPRSTTTFTFIGVNPTNCASAMPANTFTNSSRRVMAKKRSAFRLSRLTLIRSRPASRSSRAMLRSVAPFVVSAMSGFSPLESRSAASLVMSRGKCARTVGSPPVSLRLFTSNFSTQMRATRSISSKVNTSERSSQTIPSAGMQ